MNTIFIGIDLAWRSRNPTGAAVLKGDRSGARMEIVTSLSPAELTTATPALLPSAQLDDLLSPDLTQLRGRKRKEYEDELDALFCAYLAFYFWYWRGDRTHLFGDTECGYILNPILSPPAV